MTIREASSAEKEKWNSFVASNESGSFLQSWAWSEFVATQNEKVWRLVAEEANEWRGVCLVYKSRLKFGQSVLYVPRGPLVEGERSRDQEIGDQGQDPRSKIQDRGAQVGYFLAKIDELAKQENAMVAQIDIPDNDSSWCKSLDESGYMKSPEDIMPRHTLILDLRPDEETLLAQMHQKTRYNLNIARKKGVTIEVDNGKFKEFYDILKKTEQRQSVSFFTPKYFKELLKVPFVHLYLAKHDGRYIAANIMIRWNHTAVYMFGATDYEYRNVMSPYLLQWQAMHDAKKDDCWFYDFWGAAPESAEGRENAWAGFTRFKRGFSPDAELTEYLGTYEKQYAAVKLGLYRFLKNIYRR